MRRLSPSSQLVFLAVGVALLVLVIAGAERRPPGGVAVVSVAESVSLSPVQSPPSPSPSATARATPPATLAVSPSPNATLVAASAAPTPTAEPGSFSLAELLAQLATAVEQRTGYDRDLFVHWIDADGDGCDTRREVLIAESLTTVTAGANCSISGGSWVSLYDDLAFTDPSGLDIDHMVPLAEAWDSGAYGWSGDRRQRFANDLDVSWSLIAVSASSNRSKSDQDPADWLPPSSGYMCTYLGDWLAIKVRWSLSVDSGERTAISGDIGACPDTRRPVQMAP